MFARQSRSETNVPAERRPLPVQPHEYRSMLDERGHGRVAEIDRQIAGFAVVYLAAPTSGRSSWTPDSMAAAGRAQVKVEVLEWGQRLPRSS